MCLEGVQEVERGTRSWRFHWQKMVFELYGHRGNDSLKLITMVKRRMKRACRRQPQSIISGKHKKNIEGCPDRFEKRYRLSSVHARKSRNDETMESRYRSQMYNMTQQQKKNRMWNQWFVFQTTAGGSNTMPSRHHSGLGQAHRARMNSQSVQRTTASQAGNTHFLGTPFVICSTTHQHRFQRISNLNAFFSMSNCFQDID